MKIIVLGNAGAGKTTMARHIVRTAGHSKIPCLSLDRIAWNPGPERKPLAESTQELLQFIQASDRWIIEGCYGDLVRVALPYCTQLRFLNPGVDVCVAHCYSRPWESEKFASDAEQQAMLSTLINWVQEYETRSDEYGLSCHKSIYDNFRGNKQEYRHVDEYF